MRASVLGAGKRHGFYTEEHYGLGTYLKNIGVTEVRTGGGAEVPNDFCINNKDRFKYSAVLPHNTLDELSLASDNWRLALTSCLPENILYIGGMEEGNLSKRDYYTVDSQLIIVLPWGRIGTGTGREVLAATKHPSVRKILFLTSNSTHEDPEIVQRIELLHQTTIMLNGNKNITIELTNLNTLSQ